MTGISNEPVNASTVTPVKCLVVDDLEDNLLAVSALLTRDDVEILLARSGPDALELLLVHDVALALLDVQMPGMDGFELAELMRGSERTRHVPIIFLTAGSRDQHRLFRGYEAGGVDFIYKPIEPAVLQNKANVFFSLHRNRQRLAEELQERTELLRWNEMFIAMLGHDLRNPLSAIIASAEYVQLCSKDKPSQKAAVRIVTSATRMSRMIDTLFDLARARLGGGIAVLKSSMDLGVLAERVVQEHRIASPARRIELLHDGDLQGCWDPDRLAQIFSNLIGNALHHGAPESLVRVRINANERGGVQISVRNDGQIPAEQLHHLFDPFGGGQRRDTATGLGLGLYIVQQIARAHGGSVSVATPPGEVELRVDLPR